jgi:hypothetical protein
MISLVAAAMLGQFDAGLVGHWPFNDGAGVAAVDVSGNGHHGLLENGPMWTPGYLNGALSFDGVSQDVRIVRGPALDNLDVKSVTAWVRPSSVQPHEQMIVGKGTSAGCGWQLCVTTDGGVKYHQCFTMDAQWVTVDAGALPGRWTHVAVVYDRRALTNTPTLYLDAVAQPLVQIEVPMGVVADESAFDLAVGSNGVDTVENFGGEIDDVWLFNGALTASDVAMIAAGLAYDAGVGASPDGGASDAGPPDAGPPDAGAPDAGSPDAGPPDAGAPDAGPPDAGPPDAGPPDAGLPDAGLPDGGSLRSAEVVCGCEAAPAPMTLLLLSLALLRRLRAPRRPSAPGTG